MTPADHGTRKAHAEPSTQSPPEETVEPIANAVDQQPNEAHADLAIEMGVHQPVEVPADLSGKLAAALPAQPDAPVPPHMPVHLVKQAPAAPPAAPASQPSAKMPDAQMNDAPAEVSAEPQDKRKANQSPRRAQRDIAALDELHAYVMSCGGALDEGWTVQFQQRGNGPARPAYLPPQVGSSFSHVYSFWARSCQSSCLGQEVYSGA